MTESQPLRPIGTEFEEIIETPTERKITRLQVVGYYVVEHGAPHELINTISYEVIPKRAPAPSEKK